MQNKLLFFTLFIPVILLAEIHEKNNISCLHEHVYIKKNIEIVSSGSIQEELVNKNDNKIADKIPQNGSSSKSKTLVVLDLDNTTFRPSHDDHASDQWFSACVEHIQKKHKKDLIEAIDIVLPEYIELQKSAIMEPVEKDIVELISKFQKDNINVIAVTARSLPLVGTTLNQLKSINIDLSHNCLAQNEELEITDLQFDCKYKNGILFVSNNNKGEALKRFLKKVNYCPEKIICVDDRLKHVQCIEKICLESNIEFVGIRYGHLDEKVKAYILPDNIKEKLSQKV